MSLTYIVRSFLITAIALISCAICFPQTNSKASFLPMMPSLDQLSGVEDLVDFDRKVDKSEKRLLGTLTNNPDEQCKALSELVAYRFTLRRISAVLSSHSDVTSKKNADRLDVVSANVVRANELYTRAAKECSLLAKPPEVFWFARFAHAWLGDNSSTPIPSSKEQFSKFDEAAANILDEYDAVLNEYRRSEDKQWIDPTLLLYSYANSLLKRAEFERAGPLLSECLRLASEKYGADSPSIVPILRLLSGIANTAGDETSYAAYKGRIDKANGASGSDSRVLFDLRGRADPQASGSLYPESQIMVSGTRDLYETRTDRMNESPERVLDLPAPGQSYVDTHLIKTAVSTNRRVRVLVNISETGSVTSVDFPYPMSEEVMARFKDAAMALKFRPMVYAGKPYPMKGFVYLYARYSFNGKPMK